MYHHRYQPSHLANKTATAFASNNYTINSYPSPVSALTTTPSNNNNNNVNHHFNHNHNNSNNYHGSNSYSGPIQNHIVEERQDVIFRKVRGILNKITPETFDKLTKELVNVGLNSPRTLRGVIYLLFDKALKDLKYSSLYAKLCQELSEKAPNFEQEQGPNTFCKFLISKCEDEFERRRKATEDFDSKNELTDEEFEQKAIAKQKMLGNIKFICELGKKRLLQEEILHECIRGLLSKKKERPIQDQAQDLECLCQIMRTIGSLLDVQASRNLMNQYFERIDLFSRKLDLPSRIRFMLRDVIDLRNNNWRPRPFQREDNVPQTLSKLREEAGYDPSASSTTDKFGNSRNLISIGDLSTLHGDKLSMLVDDGPSFTTSTDFHFGSAFTPLDHQFDAFSSLNTTTETVKPTTSTTISRSNTSNSSAPFSSVNQVFHKSASFQHDNPVSDTTAMRFDKQPSVMNSPGSRPLGSDTRRFLDGLSFDKRPFSETNVAHERDPSTNLRTLPGNQNHLRIQSREIDPTSNNIVRRSDRDERQPVHPIPGDHLSPNVRSSIPRRPLVDSSSHPQAHHQPNHRYDFGRSRNENIPDNRERRFHRNDHQERDFRQNRFTNNANYRRGRNEKPPPPREHHYFDRPNQPESELNLNWRAGPTNTPTGPPQTTNGALNSSSSSSSDLQKPVPKRNNDKFVETTANDKLAKPNVASTNIAINQLGDQTNNGDPFIEKRPLMERGAGINRNDKDPMISNSRGHQLNHIGGATQQPPQRMRQLNNQARFPEVNVTSNRGLNTSPARVPPPRRAPYEQLNQPPLSQAPMQQNLRQNTKVMQSEISEKREPRKSYPLVTQDTIEPQPKHNENGASFHQERNYRYPPNDRNLNFERHHNNDLEKLPNWRRGPNFPVGTGTREQQHQQSQPPRHQQQHQSAPPLPQPKVQQAPILSPLLSKPPTKISDSNFSLRPSHNLIGRAGFMAGASSNSTSTKADSNLKVGGQSTDSQELLDSSKFPIKNQSEHVQEPLPASANLPAKSPVSSEANLEGIVKVSSTPASPTRAAARDFHVNKFVSVISECFSETSPNLNQIVNKVKELKIPRSYQHECLVSAMKRSILGSENDRDNIGKLFIQLMPSIFEAPSLLNAFKVMFEQMHALEVETPKVKSLVAGFLIRAVLDGLITLEEIGNVLAGGKHHPLFLLCLQKLEKNAGQSWLIEKFSASKINLMDMLPEADRSKGRLASILRDRCLGFLDPMLTIEPDLWEQMKERDPSPAGLYRWIKDNVDQTIQSTPTFAHVLISCLMKYIHHIANEKSKSGASDSKESEESGEASQSNKSSPSTSSQSSSDLETELLTKYQQVLQALLKDKQMQLATLYSVQSFYHGLDFPKGALLRWFHMLYDMEIVDDDVYFIWKEEINDEYPGKGQALFQVNTWLNWLAEAESEEEEDA